MQNPDWRVFRIDREWWARIYHLGRCEVMAGPFKKPKHAENVAKQTLLELGVQTTHSYILMECA